MVIKLFTLKRKNYVIIRLMARINLKLLEGKLLDEVEIIIKLF